MQIFEGKIYPLQSTSKCNKVELQKNPQYGFLVYNCEVVDRKIGAR